MKETNIIIADTNIELMTELKQLIDLEPGLNILTTTNSGKTLLELLNTEAPDMIIMDLILRDLDGLEFFKCINEFPKNKRPKIIIISSLWNEVTLDVVFQYNIQYYLLKPMELNYIVNRIKDFVYHTDYNNVYDNLLCPISTIVNSSQDNLTIESLTAKLLSQLGFPVHVSAYNYLIHAIEIVVNDPCAVNMVTKKVYPVIAKRFNTLESRVERSLRYLIETAWKTIKQEILYQHFALSLRASNKPSNSELIAVLADKIRLDIVKS